MNSHARFSSCLLLFPLFLSLYLSLCCIVFIGVSAQTTGVQLPGLTTPHYSVVNAAFTNLGFSLHYQEYGTHTFVSAYSRYFMPETEEYVDFTANTYALKMGDAVACYQYNLSQTQDRLVAGSTALLYGLTNEGVGFTQSDATIRSQSALQYSATVAFTNNGTIDTPPPGYSASVDGFLQAIHSTAHVGILTPYNVSVNINVYLAADADGNLIYTGNGATPLQFTVTSTQAPLDGLNIQYDFMNWAQLNAADPHLRSPICNPAQAGTTVPPIPSFGPIEPPAPLPVWGDCQPTNCTPNRVIVEITATPSGGASIISHVDALERLVAAPDDNAGCVAQEMITQLSNAATFSWTSYLTVFTVPSITYNQFTVGAIYTITTNGIPDGYEIGAPMPTCNGATFNVSTNSPLQWQYAPSLLSMFHDSTFFTGAKPGNGHANIRGIITDTWSLNKTMKNGLTGDQYDFTVQIYAMASGWGNMGRISNPNAWPRQMVRLDYTGTWTDKHKVVVPYTLRLDFFTQHEDPSVAISEQYSIVCWNCSLFQGGVCQPTQCTTTLSSVSELASHMTVRALQVGGPGNVGGAGNAIWFAGLALLLLVAAAIYCCISKYFVRSSVKLHGA